MSDHRERADWERAWDPVVARVGQLIDEDVVVFGPDRVEAGAIRRFLEPIELACNIHTDPCAARRHGWPDVVAPDTAVWSVLLPAVWSPDRGPLYPADANRDTQPAWSPIGDDVIPDAPPTSAVFGVDVSLEFDRPLRLGERAGAGPRRLLSCTPKETRVGRGAFVRFERDVVVESGERICRTSAEIYLYDPHTPRGHDQ